MKHSFPVLLSAIILTACTPKAKTFTFVQLTDPQIHFVRDTGIEGVSDFQLDSIHLEQAVAKVNELSPAFVVVTGDMVHDPKKEYDLQVYQKIIGKIDPSIPVYHIPGNHDIKNPADDPKVEAYLSRYGYDRFSFEYEGSKFIGYNSCVIRQDNVPREQEQFQWLTEELAAAKKKNMPVYVFAHCPVFLDSFDEEISYHALQPEVRSKYWELFKASGVKAMIAGHLHYNKTTEFEGITTVINGPVGYSFENNGAKGAGGKEGLRLWTINPDSFSSEFIYLSE